MSQPVGYSFHAGLVQDMARTLGVNLADELNAARLLPRQFDSAVQRCTTCPDPEGCALWLADHPGGAFSAPPLCRNYALLENLRNYH